MGSFPCSCLHGYLFLAQFQLEAMVPKLELERMKEMDSLESLVMIEVELMCHLWQ